MRTRPLPRLGSLSRASLLRFGADLVVTGGALLTSVVTARNLGPAGKGSLSTLSYLVTLTWLIVAMGAGDAAVSLIGGRRADERTAFGATIGLLAVTSLICCPLLFLVTGWGAFGLTAMHGGRLAAIAAVPASALAGVLPLFAEYRRLFAWTAAARAAGAIATLAATVVLVRGLSLSVFGGMLAVGLGPVIASIIVLVALFRSGALTLPRWDGRYLAKAVRIGIPVQIGYLVAVGAARADVLVLAALRSAPEVGIYSVALTAGQLVTLPAAAISAATFPRVAAADRSGAAGLTRTTMRTSLVATMVCAAALALAGPIVVTRVFGEGFRDAIVPVEILVVANIAGAVQWVATRACAARGEAFAVVRSFGTTIVVMVLGDLALIPRWGARGAAVAALVATVAGTVVSWRDLARAGLSWTGARSPNAA